jgi:hypothetical protein
MRVIMLSDERIRQIAAETVATEDWYNFPADAAAHSIRAALAEAAQVPVVERNQCDGCNRGLQVCDDGLHREPSGHPVMACTRNKYTHSIPATELASLREKAAMVDELQKRAERMQKALSDIAEWTDRYTTPGHPIANIARAAIAKERQS